MSHRIVTISDHIDCPTGFGTQHRLLATALAKAGLDVHSLGIWDGRPVATTPDGITRYPGGNGADDHRTAWAMYHDLLRPDLVITLGDAATFAHLNDADRPFAWCHWLPIDAEPYPAHHHAQKLRYDRLVAMSHFGLGLLRPHLEGRVPLHYIPHGIDTRVFRPHTNPLALRRKWSARLGARLRPTDFVLIARDTNQWRKQLPLLLDALAQLPHDVKLILHCRPVAHANARGWDLPHLARSVYGVADRVVFTGEGQERPDLSPRELAELDSLADLRVSATQGEGFGICTIEAMACGTPTLITDYATSKELVAGIVDCQLPIADRANTCSSTCSRAGTGSSTLCVAGGGTARRGRRSVQECVPAQEHGDERKDGGPRRSSSSIGNRQSQVGNSLDPYGAAGELVRVAAWPIEQERQLLRPLIDTADLASRVLALRADPGRMARYAEAGLRRVHAAYSTHHTAGAWVALVRRVLAAREG